LDLLDGKKMFNQIRTEIVADMATLNQLDSGMEKIEFLEGRALSILGFENSDLNRWMLNMVAGPALHLVEDHNENRADTFDEILDFLVGFKDGIVGVTGEDSKAYRCNSNITAAEVIWYENYTLLVEDEEKWTDEN